MQRTASRQSDDNLCGLRLWHPQWMQKYATSKMFMAVYSLLGTIQAMSYMYFIVTLTTIEKRFKIPSQTTGIVLSGNEISQIMLSLILSYIGGQRNRPRWLAWGIVFCALSCFIIALPHFIYGAGDDAYHLTQEYLDSLNHTNSFSISTNMKDSQHLCGANQNEKECDTLFVFVPLALIFLSQFVLGIGNTMYFSLGQTYLDDNTKKTNAALMLSVAMSLRMIGPVFGFFLGYIALNMFIDTTKTPIIDSKDPRWMGAWWFGWIILGTFMLLCSGLIGLFPKELPKSVQRKNNSHTPQVLRNDELPADEMQPLNNELPLSGSNSAPKSDLPTFKDFPKALMRLLRNKLLMYNIFSGIFYILGTSGFMTFYTKYIEVQFHKNSQNATVITGPVTICAIVIGLLCSGLIISKKKPSASKVLMWNVIIGVIYIVGQISYIFMYCGDTASLMVNGKLNVSMECNSNCSCDGVPYSPVCHASSEITYFSACHAGCQNWDSESKVYSNCSCIAGPTSWTSNYPTTASPSQQLNILPTGSQLGSTGALPRSRRSSIGEQLANMLSPGACLKGCETAFWIFSTASMVVNCFASSGRIGNILVNYRAVATEDKSFAQGLTLMLISLFALIPGPIIFGRMIDSTCLLWTKQCGKNGNCQLYDQTRFRQLQNLVGACLTCVGVFFDVLVWYYGRDLDLYGEKEAQQLAEQKNKNTPITTNLTN